MLQAKFNQNAQVANSYDRLENVNLPVKPIKYEWHSVQFLIRQVYLLFSVYNMITNATQEPSIIGFVGEFILRQIFQFKRQNIRCFNQSKNGEIIVIW